MLHARRIAAVTVVAFCAIAALGDQVVVVNPGEEIPESLLNNQHQLQHASTHIHLAPGVHHISNPLLITSSNIRISGSVQPGAPSILDGGIVLPPFTNLGNGTWRTYLPLQYFNQTSLLPTQLIIGGQRRIRARSPNALNMTATGQFADEAMFHMAGPLEACSEPSWGKCPDVDRLGFVVNVSECFPFSSSEAIVSENAYVLFFNSWTAEWATIGSFNTTNNTLLFAQPAQSIVGSFGTSLDSPGGGRWMVENTFTALDAPGEWYIPSTWWNVVGTTTSGSGNDNYPPPVTGYPLYYIPMPGETISTVLAVVPSTPTLLFVQGTSEEDPVSNFVLENVQVRNFGEERATARTGFHYSGTGALQLIFAVNTIIQNVSILHGMGNGILVEKGIQNLTMDRIMIEDTAGNGISMMLQDGVPRNATNVVISNSTITNVGFVHLAQPAGICAAGENIVITHNEVSFVPYGAIQAGWQSGSSLPNSSNWNNLSYSFSITYNYVHDYGQGVLSDFGGIYTSAWGGDDCWVNPDQPTRGCYTPIEIHHNVVQRGQHYKGGYGSNNGYMDEGIDGVYWHHNVFADTGNVNLYFHCGSNNTAMNNIFYNAQMQGGGGGALGGCNTGGYTPADGSFVTFKNNIVEIVNNQFVMDQGDVFDYSGFDTWNSDLNVFCAGTNTTIHPPFVYANHTLGISNWTALSGNDKRSVETQSSQLNDPSNGDFTVIPNSFAWAMGWEEIDVSSVGPL